ncbi:aromatic amino acid lyase [Azospirillum oleiclasticum]|uniref:aromatic amino acid lyase n=1 Tax=Azospirillum oleiclasticum TaxID=2735135 RepID=UPI001FFF6ACE|nr:aromatic amino acid lyase [Azospirillum oleiclasticum]
MPRNARDRRRTPGRPADLTADAYERVAYGGAALVLGDAALERVAESRGLFLKHLATGVICYGVNTGLGALSKTDLTPEEMALLPRQILMGRAAATGAPYPAAVARGMLLVRLAQFLGGAPAVTPALCRVMAERLNDGMAPYVPSQGHGMAGEIIPLTHMAQPLIGEGFVLDGEGHRQSAADWHTARGLAPYDPQPKEGIALINGVAAAPAVAWHALRRLRATRRLAGQVAAMAVDGLAAPLEPFHPAVADLRPDPGLGEAAAEIMALVAGSAIERAGRQAPVSFRVIPQIHGVLSDALDGLETATLREMTSVGDNPAFLADAEDAAGGRLLHAGNFHAAALTHAVEGAALALAQAGLLSERRLHRLLDPRFSGLSPQLAKRPGLDAGLVTLHKAVLGYAARLRSLAVPPSLQHGDSSFGQEDVMTMTLPALDRLAEIDGLVRIILVHEAYAAAVALDQRAQAPGEGVDACRAAVRAVVPPYEGDRSYGPEIEALLDRIGDDSIPR